MKLKYAKIVNFRSIKDIKIEFNPSCRILVGINESGKSNILRALSMIGEGLLPTDEDAREPLPNEKPIVESYIWFVFEFDKKEMEEVCLILKEKILMKDIKSLLLQSDKTKFNLYDFCQFRNEGLFSVDIPTKTKETNYFVLGKDYKLSGNWKRPSATCPEDFSIELGKEKKLLKDFVLINADDYKEIPETHTKDVDVGYINDLVGKEIVKLIQQSLPKVVVWQYEEKNLLPPSINIDSFLANTDSCLPLKNMFMLAGIKDIAGEINKAKQSPNKLRNLLARVATHSTTHFRDVWKEYKSIKFALEPNANNIEANIVEKNHWRMNQRSDGMKRFITFLLHISANVKSDLLSNVLLIVDEPDISLHPSGSRYLRDELIEISKKNYVIFSTHSIFMIDKDNIGRHIIVKKEDEGTNIKDVTKSNFVDEEVLFNALNFSIFEILKNDNIIFEGWRDKLLFETALKKIPDGYKKELKDLEEKLKNIGLCYVQGVRDVKNITPLIELANRNCIIISDGDIPAKEKQKEYEENHGYGIWKRYDEIYTDAKIETSEDFIKESVFLANVEKIKKAYSLTGDPTITQSGRLSSIKQWIASQKIDGERSKEIVNVLKEEIFRGIKSSDIENTYYDFLKNFYSTCLQN